MCMCVSSGLESYEIGVSLTEKHLNHCRVTDVCHCISLYCTSIYTVHIETGDELDNKMYWATTTASAWKCPAGMSLLMVVKRVAENVTPKSPVGVQSSCGRDILD